MPSTDTFEFLNEKYRKSRQKLGIPFLARIYAVLYLLKHITILVKCCIVSTNYWFEDISHLVLIASLPYA